MFKLNLIKTFFLLIFMVSIVQLFRLQVLEYDKWSKRAQERDVLSVKSVGQRGSIFFADSSPLAYDEKLYRLFVYPDRFKNDDININTLQTDLFYEIIQDYTSLTIKEVEEIIDSGSSNRILVTNDLNEDDFFNLWDQFTSYPDIVTYEEVFRRKYPNNQVGSKFLGFVAMNDDGVRVGRYGVEEYFDGVLRGTEGILEGKKDQRGRIIVDESFDSIRPKDGIDLVLSLDRDIQKLIEERTLYYMDLYKAKEATVVAIEPSTGRIIAGVNYPTYDANKYYEGEYIDCSLEYYILHEDCNEEDEDENQNTQDGEEGGRSEDDTDNEDNLGLDRSDEEEKTLDGDGEQDGEEEEIDPRIEEFPKSVQPIFREEDLPIDQVLRNTANSFLYEPGSVIKVFTLATAYEYATIDDNPNLQLGGHNGCIDVIDRVICTANKLPRSSLTVSEMIKDSDNIGALRLAQTIDRKDMIKKFQDLGLGKKTGIELADENQFKMKSATEWNAADQATASFGQGSVSFTPIQLAHAWNILASGGKEYKPTIIQAKDDNGVVEEFNPIFVDQVFKKESVDKTISIVADAYQSLSPRTTEFYNKYPFAGKTGTASIPDPTGAGYLDEGVNTTFIGHAPLDNPEVTLLVWFREPKLGEKGSIIPNASDTSFVAWLDMMEGIMQSKSVVPENR